MPSSSAQDRQVSIWFQKIQSGEIKLPRFQRHQAWDKSRVCSLLDTVTKNLPLGVTLLLDVDKEQFVSRYLVSAPETQGRVTEHLLDGQQRLITLLLFLKTLSIYQPELNVLKQILEQEDWEGNEKKPRITSDIFEANDGSDLMSVLQYDSQKFNLRLEECTDKKGVIIERKCRNKFERNILYFYSWLKFFSIKNDLKKSQSLGVNYGFFNFSNLYLRFLSTRSG